MKYVLVLLPDDPRDRRLGPEYLAKSAEHVFFETRKLSEAKVWDNFDDIADYVEDNKMDEYKVVKIDDKTYFLAKLAGW